MRLYNNHIYLSSLLLFVLVLCFCLRAEAQTPAEIRASVGVGSYLMRDMKGLQQTILKNTAFNAKITNRFPVYFNYSMKYLFASDTEGRLGIVAEFGSTGGRVAYADYSGSYREDQLVQYRRIGAVMEHYQPLRNGLAILLGLEGSLLHSKLIHEGEVKLTRGDYYFQSYTFYSWGAAIQPYLSFEKKAGPVKLGLQAGATMNISKTFHLEESRRAFLVNPDRNNEQVSPDWTGLRLGIYAGIPLSREKSGH